MKICTDDFEQANNINVEIAYVNTHKLNTAVSLCPCSREKNMAVIS